jgi:hypothetical protein
MTAQAPVLHSQTNARMPPLRDDTRASKVIAQSSQLYIIIVRTPCGWEHSTLRATEPVCSQRDHPRTESRGFHDFIFRQGSGNLFRVPSDSSSIIVAVAHPCQSKPRMKLLALTVGAGHRGTDNEVLRWGGCGLLLLEI